MLRPLRCSGGSLRLALTAGDLGVQRVGIEVADVNATHVGGATSSDSDVRDRLFHASAEAYVRKHFGSSGWQVYRAAIVIGSAIRALVLKGERRAQAARRRDLYRAGPERSARGLRP